MDEKTRQYYRDLYEKLRQQYTLEALAESFVFPSDLTEEEKEKEDKKFWEFRRQLLLNRSEAEKMLSGLLGLKYRLQEYLDQAFFDPLRTTGHYLQEYMNIVQRKQVELADDIDIHPTRLNRILNDKERLSLSIAYRLERHSDDTIPAMFWWKLGQKEMEQEIRKESEIKAQERSKVKRIALNLTSR